MRTAFFLLIALTAFLPPAGAEEDEPPLLIQEVRQPPEGARVAIISREQLERSQMPFVLDLLRTVPGLHVIQAGGPGSTTITAARGSRPEQVLLMLDGERYNGGLLPVDLAHLLTTNVDRIEIEFGPQSAVEGSAAVGAVVRIFTRAAGPIISARGEYGSKNTGRFSVRSGAGSNDNNYAISFERYDTDGETINSDYRNDTLSARAKVMITRWTSAAALVHDSDTDGGAVTPAIEPPFSRRSTRTRLFSFPVRQQITRWASLEAGYSALQQDVNSQSSRTNTFRVSGHIRPAEAHNVIAGYEHENQKTSLVPSGPEQEIINDAVFAEYRWTPSPLLQASLGMRVDDDNLNGSHFSPRITASYRLSKGLRIHGSAGSGYRRPATEEIRFVRVRRERADGFDLGAEIIPEKRITASATFFHTRYSDTIFNLNVFETRNLPPDSATGAELQATIHATGSLDISGNYTLTHTDGPSLIPEHSGFIQANYVLRRLQWVFNWYLIGKSLAREGYAPADTTITFGVWKGLQAYARVTNLFDSSYAGPEAARAAYFGLRWN